MKMRKLRKYGIIFLVLLMALMCAPMAMAADTEAPEWLSDAFKNGGKLALSEDVSFNTGQLTLSDDKTLDLDLNGHTIEWTANGTLDKDARFAIVVKDGATLNISDSGTVGAIKALKGSFVKDNDGARAIANYGTVNISGGLIEGEYSAMYLYANSNPSSGDSNVVAIMDGGKLRAETYALVVFGKTASFTLNNGTIEATSGDGCAISGNGSNTSTVNHGGTEITINDGEIIGGTKAEGAGIYHPQSGMLHIKGGKISGYDGIQMKAGTLVMEGGSIVATGALVAQPYTKKGDGTHATGSALSLLSQGEADSSYKGNIEATISGNSELKSDYNYAVVEAFANSSTALKVKGLTIAGGVFIGKDALKIDNLKENISVIGGTYSSDPKVYVREPYVVKPTGDTFTVQRAGVVVTPDTAELVLDFAPVRTLTVSSEITTESITWNSEDPSVVTVDGNGNITAVGAGTANVTATGAISGSVGKCVVTVRKAAPVSVTPANMELKIGETGKVEAKYDAKDSVSWSSSNQAVATVKDGTVTAGKKAGVAIITAKGTYTSAACTLTVIDPVTPDPTPTPAPVDPGTVGNTKNPVNNEKDKPENVEAATPAIKEATEDAKDDIANTTNIKKENLVATANGTLTISPVLAKSALEEVMSADKEVAPKNVVLLPIVSTNVKEKNVAAMAFSMTGAQLGAEEGTVAGDVKIIKVLADGKGAQFGYASSAAGYQDETFTLKDANDKTLALTDKVVKTSDYKLIIFVADGGKFDLDKTPGSVVDPIAVATNAAKPAPTPHSSSSGCNAGFAGLLLLAAVPFIYRRKR